MIPRTPIKCQKCRRPYCECLPPKRNEPDPRKPLAAVFLDLPGNWKMKRIPFGIELRREL